MIFHLKTIISEDNDERGESIPLKSPFSSQKKNYKLLKMKIAPNCFLTLCPNPLYWFCWVRSTYPHHPYFSCKAPSQGFLPAKAFDNAKLLLFPGKMTAEKLLLSFPCSHISPSSLPQEMLLLYF